MTYRLSDLRFVLFSGAETDVQGRINQFCRQDGAKDCELVAIEYNYQGPEWESEPEMPDREIYGSDRHGILLVFKEK